MYYTILIEVKNIKNRMICGTEAGMINDKHTECCYYDAETLRRLLVANLQFTNVFSFIICCQKRNQPETTKS